LDRHRGGLPQTTEGKATAADQALQRTLLRAGQSAEGHHALTLQRLAVTVKLTNTHLAA